MSSSKIIRFPRRFRPPPRSVARAVLRRRSDGEQATFGLLLMASLLLAFVYLSGMVGMARHDERYATLLAGVWAAFFGWDRLLRSPRFGPFLSRVCQVAGAGAILLAFGSLYALIYSH